MEKKMNAAVANAMYPAYRMTGMENRMLASIQQQNAVLEKLTKNLFSATITSRNPQHDRSDVWLPESCRGVSS